MSDDAAFLAREIADLRRRLEAMERGAQLSSSSVDVEGTEVPLTAALASANGANRNYYLPAAEPPESPTEGDLWFVTDEDNRLQRWDGDSWEPFGLGDAAFGNVDAGSITTGTLRGELLEGEEIQGVTITGGTIRNAASGPRVVISENTVTGMPGAVEWHDDLTPGVGDTLNSPPNIRGSAVEYAGGAQRYRLFLTSGRVDEPGQAALYLDSDRSDAVERNVATLTAKTITLSGDVTSTKPVVIQDRTWTTVPPEMLAAPFVGTVKYRYTHDNVLIIKVAVNSNGVATGANPYLTLPDALPRPSDNIFWFFRTGVGSTNALSNAFFLTDGRLRLVESAGATYASVTSTIIAPLD